MDYLVCVNVNNNDKIHYIVPVIADNDFDAGIKAHEQLKKWEKEGYKYIEISIHNGTGEIGKTNKEWFCSLSTEEKIRFLILYGYRRARVGRGVLNENPIKSIKEAAKLHPIFPITEKEIFEWLKEKHEE